MEAKEVLDQLEKLGTPAIKKVWMNHGAREPFFGVKIGDMKPLEKALKPSYELALELYATGNSDAMYLAGLIADDMKFTKDDLQSWVQGAYMPLHSETTVPTVAAGSRHGWELALEWIESDVETTASAGWCTLSPICALRSDSELDIPAYEKLLERVQQTIHAQQNRVRHNMNGFVISVGSYITPLSETAVRVAEAIGKVKVSMGNSACKVPSAPQYIEKVRDRGAIGKKRKTVKC